MKCIYLPVVWVYARGLRAFEGPEGLRWMNKIHATHAHMTDTRGGRERETERFDSSLLREAIRG